MIIITLSSRQESQRRHFKLKWKMLIKTFESRTWKCQASTWIQTPRDRQSTSRFKFVKQYNLRCCPSGALRLADSVDPSFPLPFFACATKLRSQISRISSSGAFPYFLCDGIWLSSGLDLFWLARCADDVLSTNKHDFAQVRMRRTERGSFHIRKSHCT